MYAMRILLIILAAATVIVWGIVLYNGTSDLQCKLEGKQVDCHHGSPATYFLSVGYLDNNDPTAWAKICDKRLNGENARTYLLNRDGEIVDWITDGNGVGDSITNHNRGFVFNDGKVKSVCVTAAR